jgi:AsmA protein
MTDMTNSRPLFLVVVTILLLLVALIAFWLAAMPQQMLSSLKSAVAEQGGFKLEATTPSLSFDDGLALKLNSVSLSNDSVTSLSAETMQVKMRFAALFGGSFSTEDIVLDKAVVTLNISADAKLPPLLKGRIVLNESSLRLRDATTKGAVNVSDLNGSIATLQDGSVKANFDFLLADRLTTFVGEAESAERLFTSGSPADFTVSAPGMLFGFSGQAKFSSGLAFVGQANVEANDTAALFRWLGMPLEILEGSGALRMLSGVSSQGLSTQFEKLDLKVGAENVAGKASLEIGADRTAISADVDVSRISILPDEFLLAKPWSEKPFSLAGFTVLDLDFILLAKQLQLRNRNFGEALIEVKSVAQNITVTLPQQKLAGGDLEARFQTTTKDGEVLVDTTLIASKVDAGTLLGGMFGFDVLQGPLDISAQLKMRGKTAAGLVSTAEGPVKLKSGDVFTPKLDLAAMLSKSATGWPTQGSSVPQASSVELTGQVNDGVANFERFIVKSGTQSFKLSGEIDALRQAFDLRVGSLWLIGPWSSPEVSAQSKNKTAVTPPAN